MDQETRHKANAVSKKISEEKERLEKLNERFEKAKECPDCCSLTVYSNGADIDFEVFEVAFILQEKRVKARIEKLEKEFAEL